MYLLVDNYDSFVYNLARYLEELGEEILVVRNDQITTRQAEALLMAGKLEGIVISPGPKSPKDCGNCRELIWKVKGRVPLLGVCLGHQIIGHVFGAKVEKGDRPMHGKVTRIVNSGRGLFKGLPRAYEVTRYHSLAVRDEGFPRSLQVDARAMDGTIMAISHKDMPIFGVQFHPEAVMTMYGHELLANYTKMAKEWWRTYEDKNQETAVL